MRKDNDDAKRICELFSGTGLDRFLSIPQRKYQLIRRFTNKNYLFKKWQFISYKLAAEN